MEIRSELLRQEILKLISFQKLRQLAGKFRYEEFRFQSCHSPPSKLLIASASASIDSMSKLLVGSSCDENSRVLWFLPKNSYFSSRISFNMLRIQCGGKMCDYSPESRYQEPLTTDLQTPPAISDHRTNLWFWWCARDWPVRTGLTSSWPAGSPCCTYAELNHVKIVRCSCIMEAGDK